MKQFKIKRTTKYTILRYLDDNYMDFINRVPAKCTDIEYSKHVNKGINNESVSFIAEKEKYTINKGGYLNIETNTDPIYGTGIIITSGPKLAQKYGVSPTVREHIQIEEKWFEYKIYDDINLLEEMYNIIKENIDFSYCRETREYYDQKHYKSEFIVNTSKGALFFHVKEEDRSAIYLKCDFFEGFIESQDKVLKYANDTIHV